MGALQAAHEFIDVSKRATDLDSLADAFEQALSPLGFDKFACLSIVDFENPPQDMVAFARYPEDWVERYQEQGYVLKDPMMHATMTSRVPFRWQDQLPKLKLDGIQRQIMSEAEEAGIKYGYTIPVHNRLSNSANLTVCASEAELPAESYSATHLMAVYLYEAGKRIVRAEQKTKPRLSPRERECLKWVAAGKSDWEIGSILGISQNTAHFYVEGAKRKLEVSTRIQAVVEALLSNEIQA
ncbi:MAG: LuxR family transcriptional regulator [Alphaproteobacteria bacterium]|nr:LuxR family transcriptional regulator [Alphaproteobacteria bacterium]